MGRHIISESHTVYVYRHVQESDLHLLHTLFDLGELETTVHTYPEYTYPVHVLRLSREDIDELRALLKSDEPVAQRIGFKEMVEAIIEWMEQTGEPSFEFLSEG